MSMIEICDPRSGPSTATHGAGGVASLAGKVVGFIDNTKPNFNHLVDDLAEILVANYGVKKVLKRGKRVQSIPAPEAVYAELQAEADVVITGSGD
jgi:hypothetical protein